MMAETIERLDAEFAEFPITRAADVASEAEIARAERAIGVPFPDDYGQFLLRYGGAMVGPYPIFGLRSVGVMGACHRSVVEVTRHHRSDGIPGANEWAIISEDQAGNPIGMDREGAIWIHDHDFGGVAPLARTFEEYLRARCLKIGAEGSSWGRRDRSQTERIHRFIHECGHPSRS